VTFSVILHGVRLLIAMSAGLVIHCGPPPNPSPPIAPLEPVAATVATPAAAPEQDTDQEYKGYWFEWQRLRDERDEFLKTPVGAQRCDPRARDFKPHGMCLGPHEVAARVVHFRSQTSSAVVLVVVDAGAGDGVTKDWTAALLDEGGRPVTAWQPVVEARREESVIEFPIKPTDVVHQMRVGLRIDQNLLDEIARRNTGHHM
jgi:hypothetical protein